MRRGFLFVLALVMFLSAIELSYSAPPRELTLEKIEIIYTTSNDIHFPVITPKYAVWLEGSLFGNADIKSMNLETKEIFKLNADPIERAFFYAPGIGTTVMDEYALMFDKESKTLNLLSLDGKEKTEINKDDFIDSTIYWIGRKFYFYKTSKTETSKTGFYSYDIDEAKKPEDAQDKIAQPQFLFASEKPIAPSGDYFIESGFFNKETKIYNDKFELVKTIEDYDLIKNVGNYLVLNKHDENYKNMSWHCYDIKNDKITDFKWPSFGQYTGNCHHAQNSRLHTADISSNSNRNLTSTMAYSPEKNKPFTLIEQSTRTAHRNNWKATWDAFVAYPDNSGKYSKLMIFDAETQKKYVASDPTSGAIYPNMGESTFLWVQKSSLWGSDLCMRKMTFPTKK